MPRPQTEPVEWFWCTTGIATWGRTLGHMVAGDIRHQPNEVGRLSGCSTSTATASSTATAGRGCDHETKTCLIILLALAASSASGAADTDDTAGGLRIDCTANEPFG